MTEELDVLRIISERLRAADVPFMLTGSFALGYYGKPRMTRDLDFVVALMERHVDALVSAFSTDFYIDEDAARSAIKSQRMFNLMHPDSAIKVDLIVRKNTEYRHAEFERRKLVEFAGISTWITSREDLILSKLVWARDSGSERGIDSFSLRGRHHFMERGSSGAACGRSTEDVLCGVKVAYREAKAGLVGKRNAEAMV